MERSKTMSNNHTDSVQQNELELAETCREMGEEDVLAEEVLEQVTGGGGIQDVLNHRAYIAGALNAVPPDGVMKPEASFELPRKRGKKMAGVTGKTPLPFGLWHKPSPSSLILSENSAFQPMPETQPVSKTDA